MPTWLIIALALYDAGFVYIFARFLAEDLRLQRDTDWLSAAIASLVWWAVLIAWAYQDLSRWLRRRRRRTLRPATRRSIRKFGKGV